MPRAADVSVNFDVRREEKLPDPPVDDTLNGSLMHKLEFYRRARHMRQNASRSTVAVLAVLLGLGATSIDTRAAESMAGVYLLGFRGPLSGITPPPGFYFENDVYFYNGRLSAGRSFATGGFVGAGLKSQLRVDLLTPIWITPVEILGGRLGFSATIPIGHAGIGAATLVSTPVGRLGARLSDSATTFGDPFVGAVLGWDHGNFHWNLNAAVNIPAGAYRDGELANIALNRPALDLTGAFTWMDPEIGLEVSFASGVTFNWTNPATNYRTGTELHLEGAVSYNLTKALSVGVIGYHYEQLTADSGTGASLGDFKGRVSALGGTIGYNFQLGNTPVSARVKVYREFNARNRQEGTAGFFTLSFPIGGPAPVPAPASKAYRYKS